MLYEVITMRFWFDKGIDGFRMDVIPFISKDDSFPEITPEDLNEKYHGDWAYFYGHGPHIHDYMQEMNREVLSKYDIMTVGEGAGTVPDDASLYTDPDRHELNMFYHFEGVSIGYRITSYNVCYTKLLRIFNAFTTSKALYYSRRTV